MYCRHNLVTGVAAFVAAAAITFHADLVVGEEVGNDLCPARINSRYLHTAELLSRSDQEGVKFVCKYSDNTVRVLTLPPGCSLPNAVASIADDFRLRVAMHVYTCTQTEAEPDRCVLSCDRHLRDAIASCRREEEALERIEGADATARRKLSNLRASLTCKWLAQSVDAAISTAAFDALNRELELEGCFVGVEPPGSNGAHTFKDILMALANYRLRNGQRLTGLEAVTLTEDLIVEAARGNGVSCNRPLGEIEKVIVEQSYLLGQYRSFPSDVGDLAAALSQRGAAFALLGDLVAAQDDLDHLPQVARGNPSTLNNSCFGRAILGQLDRALLDCDEALRLAPRFADVLDSRALVHLKRGEYDMAIVDYTAALDIAPKMPLSLFGRAIARERSGDPAGSKADAEAAASLQPGVAEDFRRLRVK